MRKTLALFLVVAACGGSQEPTAAPVAHKEPAPPATPTTAPTPPGQRLGDDVTPLRYDLDLTIDPEKTQTAGSAKIAVAVKKSTAVIWLHAKDLTLASVELTTADGKRFPARVTPGPEQMVALVFAQPLPTGNAVIAVTFQGKIVEKEDSGLFRQKEGDAWYAYTQFETSSARAVFPCFDEPRWKTPFRVTLRAPVQALAFTNTDVAEERSEGGNKVFVFAESKPLPTYLVAFAVGPFEVVPVTEGNPRHPTRIIVPRGHAKGTSYAREIAAPLLHIAEDYFGIPYAYGKNDLIAIPTLTSFSAMEHPGLITFRLGLLTQANDDWTIGEKRRAAAVLAHEYAHQWFGNYVTPEWWNDIWLNEGFATWAGTKMVKAYAPDWDVDTSAVADRIEAMQTDALTASRKVRQEIKGGDDLVNAFDRISYNKGLALLAMFETWAGEEPFRKGIRRYLDAHAHGTATSSDFLNALGKETGPDLPPAFSTFLDQPGIPLLTMDLVCAKGAPPHLTIAQTRYTPAASTAQQETWQIPVCVRFGERKTAGRQCMVVREAKAELALEGTKCPTWIAPNAEAAGYFHVAPSAALRAKIAKAPLSTRERLQLAYDYYALTRSGQMPATEALTYALRLKNDDNRYVLEQASDILVGLARLVPDDKLPAYRKLVLTTYGPRARAMGWSPKRGEGEGQMEVRAQVVGLAANLGHDPMLTIAARKHLDAWFSDPKAIGPAVWIPLTRAAVRDGDAALFERLVEKAKATSDRIERTRILGALGGFKDPALGDRARDMAISGEFELREASRMIADQFADPTQREAAWTWYRKNLDKIASKAPRGGRGYMAMVGATFCDAKHREEYVATFEPRSKQIMGAPRIYAQVLERIDQCIALRKAHGDALGKSLGK